MSCLVCHDFRKRSLRYGDQVRFAADFAPHSLDTSRKACNHCAVIYHAVQQYNLFEDDAGKHSGKIAWIYARGPGEVPPLTLTLEIYFKDERPKLELEIYYHDSASVGREATNDAVRHADHIFSPSEVLSPESLAWVQSHLEGCVNNHVTCSSATATTLPKRVLTIKRSPAGSLQVAMQENLTREQGVYACLSHRWGGAETANATRASYEAMLEGIAWDTIPKTFQDAIQFLSAIGIKKLWIDTYCIIQDDPLDWQDQAAQMANIYQNSYLTLAATASSNSESGCFWDADDAYERKFNVKCVDFSVRTKTQHWARLWASNSAAVFPLLTRAWVFQERLLAPRFLHFSRNELVWECAEQGDCQCSGYFAPSNPKVYDWTRKGSWRSAVEIFSTLRLTLEEDRLPAFFGFADFYARSIGVPVKEDYLAGLWRNTIHTDLLWRVDPSAQTLGTQDKRLCYCFDGAYSADSWWRCQYSYSAACSSTCLTSRKLCRYGKMEAAVPYTHEFAGTCSGSRGLELFTVSQLQKLYKEQSIYLQIMGYPYFGPTWSWASSRSPIQYWDNIREEPHRDDCEVFDVRVNYNDQHLMGSVASSCLTIDADVTVAYLQYQYLPDPVDRAIRHHDIFNYGMLIRQDQRLLDFHPDYVLCLEGHKWNAADARIYLVHVRAGVHLVLKEKGYFDLSYQERLLESSRAQSEGRTRMDGNKEYVRIGIFRIPEDAGIRYIHTYWQKRIKIV